ncbi:MAG: tetratricopeptide repeat protein [Rhizobiaceae bacterium]
MYKNLCGKWYCVALTKNMSEELELRANWAALHFRLRRNKTFMQVCNKQIRLALATTTLAFSLGVVSAYAFDPEKQFKTDEEPRTVLRYGFKAFKKGNMDAAIGAFRFGAKRNDLASEWQLARMLQRGVGIEKNHLAAYKLYSKIANRYAERAPNMQERAYVASAVIALGRYSLHGIKGTNLRRSPRRAEDHFYRAAALYKDPAAQYELGKLYRSGRLGVKQPRSAARWYSLAARKGHARAQAELGEMLFYGEGVRRRPVRGLVYMTKAATHSARKGVKSIRKMRRAAFAKASEAQRNAANKIIATFAPRPAVKDRSFALEDRVPSGAVSNAAQGE